MQKKAQKILRVVKIFDRSQHFPNELSGENSKELLLLELLLLRQI